MIFSRESNALPAFGFLASQEVKEAGVGNMGLWDREYSSSRHNRYYNARLYRTFGTSLGTKVHPCIRRKFVESDNVCKASLRHPNGGVLMFLSWGESAGSISVSLQMLAKGGDTEGLFHAGFMQSGSPTAIGDLTHVSLFTVSYDPLKF